MIRLAWEQIRTRRWRRHLWLLLSPLLILAAAAIAIYFWALHTQSGARWLWYQAESQVSGLSAQQINGSVSSGLSIAGLRYDEAGTQANIQNLKLRAAVSWLPKIQLKISELQADGVQVQLPPASESDSDEALSLPDIHSPIEVHLPAIRITHFHLNDHQQQNLVSWQQLDADLSYGESLEIRRWQIQALEAADLQGDFSLQGESALKPPFLHRLDLGLAGMLPENMGTAPFTVKLQSQGDIEQLQLQLDGHSGQWLDALSAQFSVNDALNQAMVDGRIELGHVQWPVDTQQSPVSRSQELTLTVQGRWPELRIHSQWSQQLPAAIAGPWQLDIQQSEDRWEITPQLGQGSALQFDGQITANANFQSIDSQLQLQQIQWAQLNPALAPLGLWQGQLQAHYSDEGLSLERLQLQQLEGSAQLSAQAQMNLNTEQLDLEAHWQQLGWRDEQRNILSDNGQLSLQGTLNDYQLNGQIELQADALPPGQLSLQGQGNQQQLRLDQLHLDWLEGSLDIDGLLHWQPDTQWQVNIQSHDLALDSLVPQLTGPLNLQADSQGQLSEGSIVAEFNLKALDGELLHQTLSGQGQLHYRDGQFISDGLSIQAGDSQLDLHTATAPDLSNTDTNSAESSSRQHSIASQNDQPQALHWRLQLPDASIWHRQWQGQLQAQGWLSGLAALHEKFPAGSDKTMIRGVGQIELSQWQGAGWQLESAQLDGQWSVAPSVVLSTQSAAAPSAAPWSFQLEGDAQGLHQGEQLPVSTIELSLDATPDQQQLQLQANNAEWSVALQLEGEENPRPPQRFTAQLSTLDIQHQQLGQWQLPTPAPLHWQQGSTNHWQLAMAEPLCLHQLSSSARVCSQINSSDTQQAVALTLNAVDLIPLNRWLPELQLHQGTLDADIQVQRAQDQWQTLHGFAQIQQLQLSASNGENKTADQTETDPAIATNISTNTSTHAKPRFAIPEMRLDFELDDPETLSLDLTAQMAKQSQLHSQIKLFQWETPETLSLDGTLTARWPDLAQLQELFPQVGLLAGEMDSEWHFSGPWQQPELRGETRLSQLAWGDARSGIHLSNGDIRLFSDESKSLQLNGQVTMGEGIAAIQGRFDPDDQSWQLTLHGDTLELLNSAQGKLYASPELSVSGTDSNILIDGRIAIPKARLKPVVSNNPVTTSNDVHLAGVSEPPPAPGPNIQGQLAIELGDDVKVNADSAKVRLGGGIQLEWAEQLIPNAQGKITLEDGSIRAYGQNLELSESAVLFEEGPVDNPRLSIYAERLIFGDPLVEEAGVAITGTAQNPNVDLYTQPATNEERALSYLVTGSNFDHGNGQGALSVGIYLLPKLFVSYGFGLFENGNVISTRYELSKRWSVQAVSGARDTGVDLNWSIDR